VKQKLFFLLGFLLFAAVLIGLNAVSYRQEPQEEDTETHPNRTSYNPGVSGTQAFYTLLAETGRKVVRWQTSPAGLSKNKQSSPRTFVIFGPIKRELTDAEAEKLLDWVADGGKLVVVDRHPPKQLLETTAYWNIDAEPQMFPIFGKDDDPESVVTSVNAIKPLQPSVLTAGVGSVQPSEFATGLNIERKPGYENKRLDDFASPVVHLSTGKLDILTEVPYGSGRIAFLTDPYIFSNGGISKVDNAQLAVSLTAAGNAPIAIDEFHQGYGDNQNRLFQYFAGTAVIPVFIQSLLLVGLIFYSKSRRFARAVPEPVPDRLSKLEYVSAMAELQQRTQAYDLAIENIYREFRRRAARLLGVDGRKTSRDELSRMIAERAKMDVNDVDGTLYRAEEIMHGDAAAKGEVLRTAAELRKIEAALGLSRRKAI